MSNNDWVSKMDGWAKPILFTVLAGVLVGLIYGFALVVIENAR